MENIGCLYGLCEALASADLICSSAQYACTVPTGSAEFWRCCDFLVCPVLGEETVLKKSMHPILIERNKQQCPLDFSSDGEENFTLVTGANMVCWHGNEAL